MDKKDKGILIEQMNDRLKKAQATFVVDYQGLDVESMNKIRNELRKIDVEFYVIKNRLLKLASKETDTETIADQFVGPCALAITYDDIVSPAKALVDLKKDLNNLDLKVGQISGKLMDLEGIKKLAKLPGREQLLSQVLSVMQAVPTSFVRVTNGVLVNLMNVLKAIETEKENNQPVPENN
ncbi:50S ribosomal protein L10 [Thermodesulfobacteriota bacterium]